MSIRAEASEDFGPHSFHTRNVSEGENAAHTREGAQARGFRGSIVGGAIVYGQMLRPIVARFGEAYLGCHRLAVRFKSPAFDGDRITTVIETDRESTEPQAYHLTARNDEGTELIDLRLSIPESLPPADPLAAMPAVEWEGERVEGTYERFEIGRPFRSFHWRPTLEEHLAYCDKSGEKLALYREGAQPPLHPGLVMSQGSYVVSNQFVMPFWIHGSSTLLARGLMRVGDQVVLRCVPIEKWQKGGSDWVRFYQVYLVEGVPMLEAWKTSVIKVAKRG